MFTILAYSGGNQRQQSNSACLRYRPGAIQVKAILMEMAGSLGVSQKKAGPVGPAGFDGGLI
jgi:hypothetical protein